MKQQNRRTFIKSTAVAGAGFMIIPRHVLGGVGYTAPSDKLNIAVVGAGGRGNSLINAVKDTENIVALCDVDAKRAGDNFKKFEKAAKYKDFRKMLEEMKDQIDAVMVATPDHTHAVIALPAMQLGKHVYVEKPLTHNIYEARLLTEAAKKYKVTTQMGNHGSSGEGIRQVKEWIDAGLIGQVTNVHAWTNRPVWPQGVPTPMEKMPVPGTLDWDLWQGPAAKRDYHSSYLPFKWRGWWEYGTGALGDIGCHILDVVHYALDLPYPTSAEASVAQVWVGDFREANFEDSCPPASKVHLEFPATDQNLPIDLYWYDGGMMPDRPQELGPNEPMGEWGGGVIFEGTSGKMICGIYGSNPKLLPTNLMELFTPPKPTIPRIEEANHQMNWVRACKEGTPTSSPFEFAGPLTEIVLMGNLAVRCFNMKVLKPGKKSTDWAPWDYPGRLKLEWDGPNMKVTNFDEANAFVKRSYREGWEIGEV